jgi:hypothetical protein
MPDYPHIHLRRLGRASREFRPFGGGSNKKPNKVDDRQAHARELRSQLQDAAQYLEEIWLEQKALGVVRQSRGIPLTAVGWQDEEGIRVGTLKIASPGMQLLSLKKEPGEPDKANFFVTRDNVKGLLKSLQDYDDYTEGDRPRRFNFFETVSQFWPARVEDLWTDEASKFPQNQKEFDWEVWVRLDRVDFFERCLARLGIEASAPTVFVDTAVYNIYVEQAEIQFLVNSTASVVELRSASSFASEITWMDPEERMQAVDEFTRLVTSPPEGSPYTTILDTGVNHANPLLRVALDQDDCLAVDPVWAVNDHSGHGTNMAGIALYGDLEAKMDDKLNFALSTRLESIAIQAPAGQATMHAFNALEKAVSLIGGDDRKRVLCLAQTAPLDLSDGRQSALSGVVDRAAWNGGKNGRLVCVAAGNVTPNFDKRFPTGAYDMRNAEHRLQSPSQSINALTVGASTDKCSDDWDPVAIAGDLCPSSRTSQQWNIHYAYKPDIVMEGGNQEREEDEPFSFASRQTLLLTAGKDYPQHPFAWTGETSAATARAAGLGTRLLSQYPEFWGETLRGLMVHNAEWTPAMLDRKQELQDMGMSERDALLVMMQCYGWGVPNEERLFRSAGDALTLIAEDTLHPYRNEDKKVKLREMKYFKLPWPAEILRALNQEEVELRTTLSYFAEPDPHAASRSRWDRYPSHRLRFAVKLPNDTDLEAQARVNMFAKEEDVEDLEDDDSLSISDGTDAGWTLGDRRRRRGTIHHDIWTGKAFELQKRDGVSVFPVRGWWGDRKDPMYHERAVRFSLIMSIRTKRTDVDLYALAKTKVKAANLVASPIITSR